MLAPSVLHNRDFLFLLVGRLMSLLANGVVVVAVGWHLYEITLDALALGYLGLAIFVPMTCTILFAGDIADRHDRRIIIAGSYALFGLSAIVLLGLAHLGVTALWPYLLAMGLTGVSHAFARPAVQSFIPILVPREMLPTAVAWSSLNHQLAAISGPALGGACLVFGAETAFAVALILYLGVVASSIAIRTSGKQRGPGGDLSAVSRLVEGIAYVRRNRIVLGAVSLDMFAVLLGGAAALLPIFARDVLQVGPEGLGMLRSAPAVGACCIALLLTRFPLRAHAGAVMLIAVAIFGASIIVFGLSRDFLVSLAALAVMGAADTYSVYVRSTLIQLATPDGMRGRVSAINYMFIGGSNELGDFRAGAMAAWLGAVPAVVVGGAGAIGVVALWSWLFGELRRIDRLTDVKPS